MSHFIRQPVLYPVSVAFLDDCPGFLSALRGMFPDARTSHFFFRPQQALEFVLQYGCPRKIDRLSGRAYSAFECRGAGAIGVDVMEHESRYQALAAVVVDHEMPEIDGISFLSSLKQIDCTKILLTGAAASAKAMDAFNAGLIDYHLNKSDADLSTKLRSLLTEARRRHCMSRGLISAHDAGAVYSRPETMSMLDRFVARESIVEYYWRPNANAILTFDAHGAPGLFLAWDEVEWALQCEVMSEALGPCELLDDMRARRIMPIFWPHQAYRPESGISRYVIPYPIDGLSGAFYGRTRIDAVDLMSSPLTFAMWRPERTHITEAKRRLLVKLNGTFGGG